VSSRTLAIGTSSPALSLALFEDGRLLAHDHRLLGRGHAEALVPAVAALPERGRANAIVVDIGPGSFTGIRVGIAAARALGLAWGVPVHGISAVHLAAAQAFAAQPDCQSVAVLLDAGRGQILSQTVSADFATSQLQILSPAEITPSQVPLAGAGVLLLPDAAAHTIIHTSQPDLATLFQVPAHARCLPPVAIYARPPDAQLPL
jgi:tRNA threonylcarbamoyl adenosine modification protein YeaZ